MDEALRAEAREQALGDPLLEVQVDGVLGEHARVLENDRPDRRLAAPVGELLVLLAGRAEGVEGRGPARVGLRAAVERREGPDWSALRRRSLSASGSAPSSSREQDSASRNGAASKPVQVREASSRLRQRSICAFRSSWRSRAASSSSSVTRFFSASRSACSISRASCSASRWRMPWPETALDVVVDDLREAAELLLDGLGLPDQHLEHAVLDPLREHEVVAAHLGGRLELAVDAAVALLDAARVPGQVEVEEVGAVRLEVQALAGGVGGEQDAQRVLRGVGVEPALDLLAPRAAREAVDHLDALVGAVGALDRLLEDRLQVALRALAVLGEDQDAPVVPFRRRALRLLAEGRQVGAQVLADPVDQTPRLGVGQVARLLGDLLHLVEQRLLAAPRALCGCISRRVGLRGGGDRLDLGRLLGLELFRRPLAALVVGVGRGGEELCVLVARRDSLGIGCRVAFSHCLSTVARCTFRLRANASIDERRRCCKPTTSSPAAACARRVVLAKRSSRAVRYSSSRRDSTSSGASSGRPSITMRIDVPLREPALDARGCPP